MPDLYITEKQTSGTDRWHVVHTTDAWPHKRLVVKCPTKRCAAALVSMLNTGEFTEALTRTALVDKARAARTKHLAKPGKFAIDSFIGVLLWSGSSREQPPWWPALVREIIDAYDGSVPPCA